MRTRNLSEEFTFVSGSTSIVSLNEDGMAEQAQKGSDTEGQEGSEVVEEEEVVESDEEVESEEGEEDAAEEGVPNDALAQKTSTEQSKAQVPAVPQDSASSPAAPPTDEHKQDSDSNQQQEEQQQQPQKQQQEPAAAQQTRPAPASQQVEGTTPEAQHGEERAAMDKAEFDIEAASKEMFGKLNSVVGAGMKSLGQLTQHPPAAGSSLSKLAEGITSGFSSGLGWWNTADSQAANLNKLQSLTSKPPQSLNKDSALLQLFGLNEDEQVVEQFPCKMLQTYGCRHNTFTPVLQMAFQGTMHLTDRHLCFSVEERGKQLPIKVPLSNINYATRQLPTQKGTGDLLHVELDSQGTYMAFRFESGSTLDSALALIEHLTES